MFLLFFHMHVLWVFRKLCSCTLLNVCSLVIALNVVELGILFLLILSALKTFTRKSMSVSVSVFVFVFLIILLKISEAISKARRKREC